MAFKNCQKCLHAEMCKYKDMEDKLKEDYPFIADVTCRYFIKNIPVVTEQVASKVKEDNSDKTENVEPAIEPKSVSRRKRIQKADTNKDMSDSNTDKLEFDDLGIENFNFSANVEKALNDANINTIGRIYAFDASDKAWSTIKGLNAEGHDEISRKLSAFNKPTLKSFK